MKSNAGSVIERAFDVEAIIARLKDRLGVKSDKDFAAKLKIKQSTLASWRSRHSIPLTYLLGIAEGLKVSTDWILFGEPITISVAGSEADEVVMQLAFNAALVPEMTDEEKRLAVVTKGLTYYAILRKTLTSLKTIAGLSEDQARKMIKQIAEQFSEKD